MQVVCVPTLVLGLGSLVTLASGHVALTFPPARNLNLDFLDNVRLDLMNSLLQFHMLSKIKSLF